MDGLPVEKKFLALISGPMIAVMQLPSAPTAGAVLRGDDSAAGADYAAEQTGVPDPPTAAAAGVAAPGTCP
jgi:hypothetical protein